MVYLYVSGNQGARPDSELAGCKNGTDPADSTNSLYRLDVIKVPLAHPEQAAVVTGARIFTGLDAAPRAASRPMRRRPGADYHAPGSDADWAAQLSRCHGVSRDAISSRARARATACSSTSRIR